MPPLTSCWLLAQAQWQSLIPSRHRLQQRGCQGAGCWEPRPAPATTATTSQGDQAAPSPAFSFLEYFRHPPHIQLQEATAGQCCPPAVDAWVHCPHPWPHPSLHATAKACPPDMDRRLPTHQGKPRGSSVS